MNSTNGTAAGPIDPAWAAESNTARIIAVVTVFHALAMISVGLRIYTRVLVIRAAGLDDLMMIFSALCAMGGWAIFIIQANHGLGKHFQTLDKKTDYVVFQHGAFWQTIISATGALMWLKISIALSLLRLSTTRWYKWALCTTIGIFNPIWTGLTIFYCIGGMLVIVLNCKPMSGYWDKFTKPPPKCHGPDYVNDFGIVNTAFNIFTDIVLSTLHVPIIWNLQMKRKLKLYAIGILSLGYFAVAMGIVKAVYQIRFDYEPDRTFNRSIQFWGFLQLQVGIIAACAPALKPLASRILNLSTHSSPVQGTYSKRSKQNSSGVRTLDFHSIRSRNRDQARRDQYELGDWADGAAIGYGEHSFSNTIADATATAMFVGSNTDVAGPSSGDAILPRRMPDSNNFKGIIKTTEFSVTKQGRDAEDS